jgi:cob(I)alamin adenosyltransferase
MSPFYTRSGDDGKTGQLGKGRLSKNHPRIEVLGTIDEASASLGLSKSLCQASQAKTILVDVQRDLYLIMSEISASPDNSERFARLDVQRVQWLESNLDALSGLVHPLTDFILPGDSLSGAALDLSRAIVRRAERGVVELIDSGEIRNPVILQYLNRLSSLCFALELLEIQFAGHDTTLAKK